MDVWKGRIQYFPLLLFSRLIIHVKTFARKVAAKLFGHTDLLSAESTDLPGFISLRQHCLLQPCFDQQNVA
jgi:hypothetical protein